jgi:hypothetical protein
MLLIFVSGGQCLFYVTGTSQWSTVSLLYVTDAVQWSAVSVLCNCYWSVEHMCPVLCNRYWSLEQCPGSILLILVSGAQSLFYVPGTGQWSTASRYM